MSKTMSYLGQFESLSSSSQFVLLSLGVFFSFGLHNYLQEAIIHVDGFHSGVMLGYTEVLGVCICSFFERRYVAKEQGRVAPFSAYPLLTACLVGSSAMSNISLNYINYPTKVVFRSCKLIPTMIIASVLHNKSFTYFEYLCAFAICSGLVLFAAADWGTSPSFNPIGLALVSASVCADAILPNAQERLFRFGASRLEVTLYTNSFSLLAYTVSTLMSGDLISTIILTINSKQLAIYFTIYTFIAYVAISIHMNVVKRFGGVAAVLVATARKGMTLILSFLMFPKAYSWYYPMGGLLVLGGLLASSIVNATKKKSSSTMNGQQHNSNGSSSSPTKLKHHASDVELAPLQQFESK